jgi:hypothetical protein
MTSISTLIPYVALNETIFGMLPAAGGVFAAPATITITIAALAGAVSVTMQSDVAGVILKPGMAISVQTTVAGQAFTARRTAVIVDSAVDVTVGTTAAAVAVKPLKIAIAANSTTNGLGGRKTVYPGMIPVLGVSDFGGEPDPMTGDVTGTDSGDGKTTAKFRTGQNMNCTVHERPGDQGAELVKRAIESGNEAIANARISLIRPDGELVHGIALFAGGSSPGGASTNAQHTFQLNFQGSTRLREAAYVFA